ncbi:MAG: hypothetical protein ACI8TQ_003482 [Planctomycetota bacterium]
MSERPWCRCSRVFSFGLLLATVFACADQQPTRTLEKEQAPSRHASVPLTSDRCSDCHEHQTTDWNRTAMARAIAPLLPEELTDFQKVVEPGSEFAYQFEVDGESTSLIETSTLDSTFERRVPLVFAIGAGVKDRAYVANIGSYLWFAPLEQLTTPSGHQAVFAPLHSQIPGQRFTLPITSECLGCHTDSLPPNRFPKNLRPLDHEWQPRGLSCAACHGDVESHADYQDAGEDGRDSISKISALARHERVSVCAACHLQGDARIVLGDGLQGPPAPGGDLLDQRAVFVAAEPNQDIGFVSQVERLVLSRCYTAAPEMDCASCHAPHRDHSATNELVSVRASCNACHTQSTAMKSEAVVVECSLPLEDQARANDCATCHMRRTEVFDVHGVEIHDHFIRKKPGDPSHFESTRSNESSEGNWRRFAWPDQALPEHANDQGLWMMAFYARGLLERAFDLIEAEPGPAASSLPMYHHVRGALYEQRGDLDSAAAAYRKALDLDPQLGPSAVNLGACLANLGRDGEALEVLDEHLRHHPKSNNGLRNRALVRLNMGDVSGLIRDLEAAAQLHQSGAQARTLADLYDQLGQAEKSQAYLEQATRLDQGGLE